MPEFFLNIGSPEGWQRFNALDAFTQGYVEAIFFTETGAAEDGDLANTAFEDLAPATLEQIVRDCRKFQADNEDWLAAVRVNEGENAGRAGHDFWLTRNGHGAGFWDGGWAEPAASYLTAGAHAFGAIDLYLGDDGALYLA